MRRLAIAFSLLGFAACGGKVAAPPPDASSSIGAGGVASAGGAGAAGLPAGTGSGGTGRSTGAGGAPSSRGGAGGQAGLGGSGGMAGSELGRGGATRDSGADVAVRDATTSTLDATRDADRSVGSGDARPIFPPTCLTGDVLDPAQVYLAGTLAEGSCGRDALAHWSCPNSAVVGFDCYFQGNIRARISAQIRPTDGRLIYVNSFEQLIREFYCDDCPYTPGDPYPADPLANDPTLPLDCDFGPSQTNFLVSPAGTVIFFCLSSATWRDFGGTRRYVDTPGDTLRYLGYGELALTERRVVNLVTGSAAPIVGLPDVGSAMIIRARPPDQFLVAFAPVDAVSSGQLGHDELWQIDSAGTATRLGFYPLPPAGIWTLGPSALEASGALIQIGEDQTFQDLILRREISGRNDIVYTEASNPLVKIHISGLVTGP